MRVECRRRDGRASVLLQEVRVGLQARELSALEIVHLDDVGRCSPVTVCVSKSTRLRPRSSLSWASSYLSGKLTLQTPADARACSPFSMYHVWSDRYARACPSLYPTLEPCHFGLR
jgi:hypothetical protein